MARLLSRLSSAASAGLRGGGFVSSEEATLRLRPFLVRDAYLEGRAKPAGWSVLTPAEIAYRGHANVSPFEALARIERRGILTETLQHFRFVTSTEGRYFPIAFRLLAFGTTEAARRWVDTPTPRFVAGDQLVGSASPSAELGDQSAVYQYATPGSGEKLGHRWVDVRWRRGLLGISLHAPGVDDVWVAHTRDWASWMNTNASHWAPLVVTQPALVAAANERQRLQALLRLEQIGVPSSALPSGYQQEGESVGPGTVRSVAEFALRQADAAAAIARMNGSWGRLIEFERSFAHSDDLDAPRFEASMIEDATPEGASADLNDTAMWPKGDLSARPPARRLGDETLCYRLLSSASGARREQLHLAWRHGRVVLVATVAGSPGTSDEAALLRFAEGLEAGYQWSPYARGV